MDRLILRKCAFEAANVLDTHPELWTCGGTGAVDERGQACNPDLGQPSRLCAFEWVRKIARYISGDRTAANAVAEEISREVARHHDGLSLRTFNDIKGRTETATVLREVAAAT